MSLEEKWFQAAAAYVKACQDAGLSNCMIVFPKGLDQRVYQDFKKQGFVISETFEHEELCENASFAMVTWKDGEPERLVKEFDLTF